MQEINCCINGMAKSFQQWFWMFIVRWNHFWGSVLVLFWGGNSQKLKPHQENNTSNSFKTNSFNMCVCLLYMYIARCAGKNLKGNRALECQQALTLAGKVITECIWKIMSLSWQMTRVSDWPHWSCSCAFSGKQTNKQTRQSIFTHECITVIPLQLPHSGQPSSYFHLVAF